MQHLPEQALTAQLAAAGKLLVCPKLARPGARIAYVGQSPWVQSGTILDNITLGAPLDPQLLHEVGLGAGGLGLCGWGLVSTLHHFAEA